MDSEVGAACSSTANNSTSSNCSHHPDDVSSADVMFEYLVRIIIPITFGLIAVLGFVGNLSVIVVVAANKTMRSTTNMLIIGLAAADLVFIVVCVPFTAVIYVIPVWPFGLVWCKIYQYVIHVTAHASVYTLVLMSLDRYLAVVHPITSMTIRNVRNTSVALAVAWIVIVVANLPMLSVFQVIEFDVHGELRSTCLNERIYSRDMYHARVFYGTFFAFAFLIPLVTVCLLYGAMVRRLLRNSMIGAGAKRAGKETESTRAKRRVTRLVVIVVVIFAVCWLPIQVIFMLQYFSSVDDMTLTFAAAKMVANCLAYMNSCVNPILYAFLSDNFRKGFFQLVSCCVRSSGDGVGGGFRALRKMELERTSVGNVHRISAPGPVLPAGKESPVDDEAIEPNAIKTEQTSL